MALPKAQRTKNAPGTVPFMGTIIRLLSEGKEIINQWPQGTSCLVDDNLRHATMTHNLGVGLYGCWTAP